MDRLGAQGGKCRGQWRRTEETLHATLPPPGFLVPRRKPSLQEDPRHSCPFSYLRGRATSLTPIPGPSPRLINSKSLISANRVGILERGSVSCQPPNPVYLLAPHLARGGAIELLVHQYECPYLPQVASL